VPSPASQQALHGLFTDRSNSDSTIPTPIPGGVVASLPRVWDMVRQRGSPARCQGHRNMGTDSPYPHRQDAMCSQAGGSAPVACLLRIGQHPQLGVEVGPTHLVAGRHQLDGLRQELADLAAVEDEPKPAGHLVQGDAQPHRR
jgi:hypothetical protein